MPDKKIFTIVRKRTVVQICSEEYSADTEAEALEFANDEQERNQGGNECDVNEWTNLDDVIEYPTLDADDILEVTDREGNLIPDQFFKHNRVERQDNGNQR